MQMKEKQNKNSHSKKMTHKYFFNADFFVSDALTYISQFYSKSKKNQNNFRKKSVIFK